MGWVHPTPWTLYTPIESLQSFNIQKGPPFRLSHIFLGKSFWTPVSLYSTNYIYIGGFLADLSISYRESIS